jgi:hypothetical protein
MAKKSAAPATETAAPVEALSADPTLLGVNLPVSVTLDAAKTVFAAWKSSFLALKTAIEEKLKKKEIVAEVTSSPEAPIATA